MDGNIVELFKIGRNEVVLSHLQFADDTMLFCFGKEESFLILIHVVAFFEDYSGLKINRSKCTVFVFGINSDQAKLQKWVKVFDCEVGSFPSFYLRLLLRGNSKAVSFWDLVSEKICKRRAVWKKGFFSKAGRLTLIRSMLSRITMYFLSLIRAPSLVC